MIVVDMVAEEVRNSVLTYVSGCWVLQAASVAACSP